MAQVSDRKNDIPIQIGQVLKWRKISVSNIFYHFFSAVSLGSRAEKFRLVHKIDFQNMFYTKCINIIIDSIGWNILRSILWKLIQPIYLVWIVNDNFWFHFDFSVNWVFGLDLGFIYNFKNSKTCVKRPLKNRQN